MEKTMIATTIRQASSHDDAGRIAQLVYDTDPMFRFMFGKRETALQRIARLFRLPHNPFSYQNMLVFALGPDNIQGILVAYNPRQWTRQQEQTVYEQTFGPLALAGLWFRAQFLKSLEDKKAIDGLYIQNVCVDPMARSAGIGSRLLEAAEHLAIRQQAKGLWLDVAFENNRARQLYQRLGFAQVSTHRVLWSKSGFYRMRKSLTGQ